MTKREISAFATAVRSARQKMSGASLRQFDLDVARWSRASDAIGIAIDDYYETIQPWLNRQTTDEPDLLGFVAAMGRSRLLTGDWRDTPISVSEQEIPQWEQEGLVAPTVRHLRQDEGQITFTVVELLNTDYDRVIKLLNTQLQIAFDRLRVLREQPLEGYKPGNYDFADSDDEDEAKIEHEKFDEIFRLYEKLEEFEHALELIRMIVATEVDEELKLPNSQYMFGLARDIKSNYLMEQLARTRPRMKEILTLWYGIKPKSLRGGSYGEYWDKLRIATPDTYWWRHWSDYGRGKKRLPE